MNLKNCIEDLLNLEDFPSFRKKLEHVEVSSNVPGIIEFSPIDESNQTTAYIYSCGIHGNETAPIEIINDLVRDIYTGDLKLTQPLLIIFGHIQAMKLGTRFEVDNLNRMFSGAHKDYPENNVEAKRAKDIEYEITRFFNHYSHLKKVHYDLHTAIRPSKYKRFAVYPFLGEHRSYVKDQLHIFSAMGIDAVLLMHKFSPTLSYYSSNEHQAEAFTLELGKVEKFGDNKREDFKDVEKVLRSLVSLQDLSLCNTFPVLCRVKKELIRHEEDYNFNISDDTANFTTFKKGDVLATDAVETYAVEEDGEMIAFPNGKVKVGQRSGLVMKKISIEELGI